MSVKNETFRSNGDGSTTRITRYGDGSGRAVTTRPGVLWDKHIKTTTWPSKKK